MSRLVAAFLEKLMIDIKAGERVNFIIVRHQGRSVHISKRAGKVIEVNKDRNSCSISYRGKKYFRFLDKVERTEK